MNTAGQLAATQATAQRLQYGKTVWKDTAWKDSIQMERLLQYFVKSKGVMEQPEQGDSIFVQNSICIYSPHVCAKCALSTHYMPVLVSGSENTVVQRQPTITFTAVHLTAQPGRQPLAKQVYKPLLQCNHDSCDRKQDVVAFI